MQFWYPDLPVWIPAFTSLAILTILNFVAVRLFGELGFGSHSSKLPQLFYLFWRVFT